MAELLSRTQGSAARDLQKAPIVLAADPRVRVVASIAFAVVVVALDSYVSLLVALTWATMTMFSARMPVRSTLLRVAAMDTFIVFMLIMLPFTVPGHAMFSVFGLSASWEGLHQAIVIGIKANAIVLMLLALVGTLESVTLGHALHRLQVPERLVLILLFTVRYVDVLHLEFLRSRIAMKARGFRPRNNLHTYRSYGYLVGMLLVRSLERADRILAAMKCRGFSGKLPVLDMQRFGHWDATFAFAWALLLIGLGVLEWNYVNVA